MALIVAKPYIGPAQTEYRLTTAELLFVAAQDMGLQPSWIVPKGLFAIAVDGQERYIHLACTTLNTHTGVSLAKDKELTRLILERHGMHNIPFTRPQTLQEAHLFLNKHSHIIAKPFNGSGARDIHNITESSQLATLAPISNYILEKYISGKELRYLVLKDNVVAVHESDYGDSVDVNRPLQHITYAPEQWNESLISTSLEIANILQLRFAAIDFLIDSAGYAHILEVNTNPDLKWLHAPSSGPALDIARPLLEAMLQNDTLKIPARDALYAYPV